MLGINLVDIFITVFLISWVIHGYWRGFIVSSIALVDFITSLFIAARTYELLGAFANSYGMPKSYATLLAFLIIFVTVHALLNVVEYHYIQPVVIRSLSRHHLSRLDRLAGIVPTTIGGIIWLALILGILSWFPLSDYAKSTIAASTLGSPIVEAATIMEPQAEKIAGKAIEDTLASRTTGNHKDGGENWRPNIPANQKLEFDIGAEAYMLLLVNQERRLRGLQILTFNPKLRDIARSHSMDMVKNNFFSHKSPTTGYPDERLVKGGVIYMADGENLAYSQDIDMAHTNLMESPGHRENILNSAFGKIGIGIVNAGPYGYMCTQEYTD